MYASIKSLEQFIYQIHKIHIPAPLRTPADVCAPRKASISKRTAMRATIFGAPPRLVLNDLATCLVAIAPSLCRAAPECLPTNFGPELLQEIDGHGKGDLLCP